MATLSSLAEEYANYLRLNRDNPSAASEIAQRIKKLTYTSTGQHLSVEDKRKLVQKIEDELSPKVETPDGTLTVESQDSSELIRLIQMVRAAVVPAK